MFAQRETILLDDYQIDLCYCPVEQLTTIIVVLETDTIILKYDPMTSSVELSEINIGAESCAEYHPEYIQDLIIHALI